MARGSSRYTGAVLLFVAAVICFACVPSAKADATIEAHASTDVPALERLGGRTRFGTAVAISRTSHPGGSDSLVVATGRDWPDALGGAALAGAVGAPVLLTEPDDVPAGVLAEIERLGPEYVYILGGEAAISASVIDELRSAVPSASLVRLGGDDRYRTAAMVASETLAAAGVSWGGHAFVATGRGFADALAVGPVAVASGDPVFLIGERVHSSHVIEEMVRLGVTDVTLVGGTGAISETVESQLALALGGVTHIERVGGSDRYETAALLAEHATGSAVLGWDSPGLATGTGYADAIAAGPVLGGRGSPLLLTRASSVSPVISASLLANSESIAGFTVFGGEGAVPAHVAQEAQHACLAPSFNTGMAMSHISYLAALGPRGAGSAAERAAFTYVEAQLASYGYATRRQSVQIPSELGSYNVIAEAVGKSPEVIVIGAHIDSKPPSPGGNDNASGVGVMLELARILKDAPHAPTIRFIAFGAEEISGDTPDDHHFGSRQYVESLSVAERASIHGAVSVDMVGYGETFNIRHMGVGTFSLVWSLQERGGFVGQPIPYLRDPGRYGWSDHEAFEFAGIPAAWLEWREDPDYHTVRDTAAHVQASCVRATGRVVRGWLLAMDADEMDGLR